MPCHVAWHETDGAYDIVMRCRKEVPLMINWIRNLERWLKEESEIGPEQRLEILDLMLQDPNVKLVAIHGIGNSIVAGQEKLIARLREAGQAYGALLDLVTREMCRLCVISERKSGKFLDIPMQKWWNNHRRSSGHECYE